MMGNNIEDIFKESFKGFKVNPSPNLWNGIRSKLWWKEFLQFGTGTINAYYVGAVVIGSIVTYSAVKYTGNTDKQPIEDKIINEIQNPQNNSETRNYILTESNQNLNTTVEEKISNNELAHQNNQASDIKENISNANKNITTDSKTDLKDKSVKKKPFISNNVTSNQSSYNLPVSEFKPSSFSGCQGLTVKFMNTSTKSVWQKWDFGNGQVSFEKNPSFTYNLPGEYNVKLKIKGIDDKYYTSVKTIEIFENPKAMFEIDKFNSDLDNRTIYFNNNSTNNITNKWDFGDQLQSEDVNPIHIYDADDIFLVKLKVESTKGCIDSVTIRNNFLKANYFISFPSAFTPSITGPRRGFYTPGGNTDEIFYPDFKGIAEYKLQIFSRTGILMFESTDINYGWNGYYKNTIVDMGVYIWEVTGKFYDGEDFAKNGTVTVIHKN
ncbi:PKD domain-containing protein [Bacteroidota bacterium]